jgi:ABC-type cobalamin/Fe3+-siderophores transport system ATPase subunit
VSAGPGDSLIALEAVTFGYGGAPVLQSVSHTVRAGDFTGIVGPSGSGKTSLLKALLGTVRPQRGTVQRRPGSRCRTSRSSRRSTGASRSPSPSAC